MKTLITNIGQLATMQPIVSSQNFVVRNEIGLLSNAWVYCENGIIVSTGQGEPPALLDATVVDAGSALLTPAFVDAHTHLIYAGTRSSEFAARLAGESYQSIAAKGGGIQSSVRATRAASDGELEDLLLARLTRLESLGTTTVEIKSGYGLGIADELRLLRCIRRAAKLKPRMRIISTCLALHAKSPDYADLPSYIDACTNQLLPQIATEGLCEFVDAFVEAGYFLPDQVDAFMRAASQQYGLGIRIHADEFADSGGAAAAARWRAVSADHLEEASVEGIRAMAQAGVTAVLLPGTSLYTKIKFSNAQKFLSEGVPVALASDFNPGSCQFDDLNFIASLGALHCGMNASQALAAITIVAAKSLRLDKQVGAIVPGYVADFLIHQHATIDDWIADFGKSKPRLLPR